MIVQHLQSTKDMLSRAQEKKQGEAFLSGRAPCFFI